MKLGLATKRKGRIALGGHHCKRSSGGIQPTPLGSGVTPADLSPALPAVPGHALCY